MGGCAGKNKSKSDSNKKPEKNDRVKSKPQENASVSNGLTVENNKNISNEKENDDDDDPEIPTPIDQDDGVNKVISQIFSSRVISESDTELEHELAKLVYGNPEHDYAENPITATTFKSTEV